MRHSHQNSVASGAGDEYRIEKEYQRLHRHRVMLKSMGSTLPGISSNSAMKEVSELSTVT